MVDLGHIQIHPSHDWDYLKPSWDPWFRDSSMIVYSTGRALYVASPDGLKREKIGGEVSASLPVPSPDGGSIAYVTFQGRPMNGRADLTFWGEAAVWVIERSGGQPVRVTGATEDTTLDLRWLDSSTLIFDRVSDDFFYRHARIWTTKVGSRERGAKAEADPFGNDEQGGW